MGLCRFRAEKRVAKTTTAILVLKSSFLHNLQTLFKTKVNWRKRGVGMARNHKKQTEKRTRNKSVSCQENRDKTEETSPLGSYRDRHLWPHPPTVTAVAAWMIHNFERFLGNWVKHGTKFWKLWRGFWGFIITLCSGADRSYFTSWGLFCDDSCC